MKSYKPFVLEIKINLLDILRYVKIILKDISKRKKLCYYNNKIWIKTLVDFFIERVTGFVKSEEWCVIYCCGGMHKPLQTVFLDSNDNYQDRKLEILVCPVCGSLIAELNQFNIQTSKYETFRPKKRKMVNFIRQIETLNWSEYKIQLCTKGNAGFVYGLNKELKNGKILQYAVDFNGVKKLVKVIT